MAGMLQRWIKVRPQFERPQAATSATSATSATPGNVEAADIGDVAEVADVACVSARLVKPLAGPVRLRVALIYPDGSRHWRLGGPPRGAQAITDDVRRLRAIFRAAGVELIADNRTLGIMAPSDWAGAEFSVLAANIGAMLDLLHAESDARMALASDGGGSPRKGKTVERD